MTYFPADPPPKGQLESCEVLNAVVPLGSLRNLAVSSRAMSDPSSAASTSIISPSAGNYTSPPLLQVKQEMVDEESTKDRRLRKLKIEWPVMLDGDIGTARCVAVRHRLPG